MKNGTDTEMTIYYIFRGFVFLAIFQHRNNSLTPNRPLIHTSFTYPKLNMDGFSVLGGLLGCVDSTEEVEWNSLHAQWGIRKEGKTVKLSITYMQLSFL